MYRKQVLLEKLKEAAASVLPISLIVLTICFVLVPVDTGLMLSFVLATAMLILGMGLFTLGAEMSMSKIGNYMGAKLTKSRRLGLILIVSFLLGVAITVAEPDLQVLAANVPEIDKTVLILTVSVGVGIFLMLCMVRILFGISLRLLLIVFYVLVFLAAFLSDQGILAVAFDSGGVTTGPMTVPFIMALGVGVASIRSDENAKADSFGLVGLCSIGPIASVLLLGAIYKTQPAQAESETAAAITNTVALGRDYLHAFPEYLKEVTLALLPAMVQVIILLANGNLGAGVAVSGAFGLVRFRSAPGSARDITCIFLAMTLGLATGMGYIGIAIVTGAVMCILLTAYAALSFGRKPEEEKELKITIPENLDYTGLFDDLFAQYTRASELVSVRTTGMGSLYNLHYHVRLVSPEIEKQFLDAIRCRNGNLDIVCGKVPQVKEAL